MSSSIDVSTVDQSRESHCDSISIAIPTLCPPALMFPLLTRVERVTVTPSLSFCWYPRPTSLLLFILALRAAPSSKRYLAPIPNVVAEEAELQPRDTPVSREGDTFWYTDPPKSVPLTTLVCSTKSGAVYPSPKLFLVTADLDMSKQVWYPASHPLCPTTAVALMAERAKSISAVTVAASCLYSDFSLPDFDPVEGEKLVSRVTLRPGRILLSQSRVVFKVLSVFHFSVKVRPKSFTLYLVSRFPETFPLSMLEDPPLVNSTPVSVFVFTSSLSRPK